MIFAVGLLLVGCVDLDDHSTESEWLSLTDTEKACEEDMEMIIEEVGATELTSARSPITLPKIYASGMVFQRGKSINVRGFSENIASSVRVTLGEREGVCTVDPDGKWSVELPAIHEAGIGNLLRIEEVGNPDSVISIGDVAIGEVWVMSGQSNAQLQVGYLEDVEELAALAGTMSNIRYYRASASFSLEVDEIGSGAWYTSITPQLVRATGNEGVSAVGYAAAVKLAAELGPDVPVAVIHVARGASKIKAWLDDASLSAISPSEMAKVNEHRASGDLPSNAHTQLGTVLYNKQIAPLDGYEVAGVMWYQGCGDVSGESLGAEGKSYTEYFTALEALYRRIFGNDSELPFYVMELAPYTEPSAGSANSLSEFKAEQYDFCRKLKNTYLVPIMTEGGTWCETIFSQGFIHPSRKSPVGYYTADMILANEYGIVSAEVYKYPEILSVRVSGSAVMITFDSEIKLMLGDEPMGFELCLPQRGWVKASAVIDGSTVTVSAAGGGVPTDVRYGFSAITAELADGTTVSFYSGEATINDAQRTITITKDGEVYVIGSAEDCVRMMNVGNITNASGVPLPVFSLGV